MGAVVLKLPTFATLLLCGLAAAAPGCGAARGPVFDWRAGDGGGTDAGTGAGCPSGTTCGLKAEYYRMPSYEGRAFNAASLALTRVDPQIDFDWGAGVPDALLPAGGFMARWTGFLRVPARTGVDGAPTDVTTFTVRADDGVRLWVDERLLVDHWADHLVADDAGTIALPAGSLVPLELEYYQHQGVASVQLAWSWSGLAPVPIPPAALVPPAEVNGLSATYYAGEAFDTPVVTRRDLELAFRWWLDSPDPAVPIDRFSARWTGTVEARASETYTFFLVVAEQNEGVRLSIDGVTVIDAWAPPFALESSGTAALRAGQRHAITVEYTESIGASAIELLWASASQPRTRVSWHRLRAP